MCEQNKTFATLVVFQSFLFTLFLFVILYNIIAHCLQLNSTILMVMLNRVTYVGGLFTAKQ